MSEEKDNLNKINEDIVKLVDDLLSHEVWQQSTMLKSSAKRLKAIRDRAQSVLDKQNPQDDSNQDSGELPEGYRYVYIFLFQADGKDLKKWKETIHTLPRYTLSRPTYPTEEGVRERIKNRGEKKEEGYVKVKVKEEDVISSYAGRAEQDHLGHDLVTVKESGIELQNIVQFVHANKTVYDFKNGELIQSESEQSAE